MKLNKETLLRLIAERGGPQGLDLAGQDLAGMDLSGCDLHGVILTRADLRNADLRGTNLRGADLSRAVLQGADLRWADLTHADLSWADLRNANLRGAKLDGTEMEGANLAGVDFMQMELTRRAREEEPLVASERRSGLLTTVSILLFALAVIDLLCVWGWLYKAAYFDEFGLPWRLDLNLFSWSYLVQGGQVVGLSLEFFLTVLSFFVYVFMVLGLIALLFLLFAYAIDRIFSKEKVSWTARFGIIVPLVICLVVFVLVFPRLISLGEWLIREAIPTRTSFQVLRGFLSSSSFVERILFLAFLAIFLIPLWILYRLLCQGLQRVGPSSSWIANILAFAKRSRLFGQFHPLTSWERRCAMGDPFP